MLIHGNAPKTEPKPPTPVPHGPKHTWYDDKDAKGEHCTRCSERRPI